MKSIIKISVTLAVGQYDKLSSSKVLNLTVSILVVESSQFRNRCVSKHGSDGKLLVVVCYVYVNIHDVH